MPITKGFILKGLLAAASLGGVTGGVVLYKEEISDLRVWAQSRSGSMLGGRVGRKRRDLDSRRMDELGLPSGCVLLGDERRRECDVSPEELKNIKFTIWREGDMKITEGEGFRKMKMETKMESGSLFFSFRGVDRSVVLSNGIESLSFREGRVPRYVVNDEGWLKEYKEWF